MPDSEGDFEFIATCQNPSCRSPNHCFQPRCYRISAEKPENFDEESWWYSQLPLKPKHRLSKQESNSYMLPDQRGLGTKVEAWWCLPCFEAVLLMEKGVGFLHGPADLTNTLQPKASDLSVLRAEYRTPASQWNLFHLPPPQRYNFEKWKAMAAYNGEMELWGVLEADAVTGEEGTLYPDVETRDLDALEEYTKEPIELTVAEIQGKKLSEVLRMVDERVALLHREYSVDRELRGNSKVASNETDSDREGTPRAQTTRSQRKKAAANQAVDQPPIEIDPVGENEDVMDTVEDVPPAQTTRSKGKKVEDTQNANVPNTAPSRSLSLRPKGPKKVEPKLKLRGPSLNHPSNNHSSKSPASDQPRYDLRPRR